MADPCTILAEISINVEVALWYLVQCVQCRIFCNFTDATDGVCCGHTADRRAAARVASRVALHR